MMLAHPNTSIGEPVPHRHRIPESGRCDGEVGGRPVRDRVVDRRFEFFTEFGHQIVSLGGRMSVSVYMRTIGIDKP